ncbi:MAG: MFS transporter [Candidatus Lokiarchaeota archaeon]|nr:MFS transporter [Candidatus Lokiarchaeota archaeon]
MEPAEKGSDGKGKPGRASDGGAEGQRVVLGVALPVLLLGFVSLFTDISSEMIIPVLPNFVIAGIGGSIVDLGLILGVTDAIANVIKGLSGWLSEHLHGRKKLIIAGYAVSNVVAKPLIGFQTSEVAVTLFRALDRIGKGIRTSPRDALIGYYGGHEHSGKAFGIHRSMDNLGAVFGPLLAALLLALAFTSQWVIILSVIPGIIAVVFIFFVKDIKQASLPRPGAGPDTAPERVSRQFVKTVAVLASIEFASLNAGFLIARTNEFFDSVNPGASLLIGALLFAVFNVVNSIVSIKAGKLSDTVGRKKVLTAGLVLLLAATVVLAIPWPSDPASSAFSAIMIASDFVLFGVYMGMVDPTSRAMVSDLSERKKGKAYGLYYFIIGIVSIPEAILFAVLYDNFGHVAAFSFWSLILVACIAIFTLGVKETLPALARRPARSVGKGRE